MNKVLSFTAYLVGIAVLVGGLAAGVLLVKSPLIFKEKASGQVMLYIDPAIQTKRANDTFTIDVKLDTNGKVITAFDARLAYNLSAIDIVSVQKGAGAVNLDQLLPTNGTDTVNGKISFGAFTLDRTKGINGAAIDLVKITAKLKSTAQPGTYDITFLPESLVYATGEEANALQATTPGKVIVNKKGDINGDGTVNIVDVGILIDNYGKSPIPDPRADLNGDGSVNIVDVGILIDNYGH